MVPVYVATSGEHVGIKVPCNAPRMEIAGIDAWLMSPAWDCSQHVEALGLLCCAGGVAMLRDSNGFAPCVFVGDHEGELKRHHAVKRDRIGQHLERMRYGCDVVPSPPRLCGSPGRRPVAPRQVAWLVRQGRLSISKRQAAAQAFRGRLSSRSRYR